MFTSRILVGLVCSATVLPAALYQVSIESSSRKTVTGETVAYQLYLPKAAASASVRRRFPAVVRTSTESLAEEVAQPGQVIVIDDGAGLKPGHTVLVSKASHGEGIPAEAILIERANLIPEEARV